MNYFESSRLTVSVDHVYTISQSSGGTGWYLLRDGKDFLVGFGAASPKCVVANGLVVYYELNGALQTSPGPDGGPPFAAAAPAIDLAVDDKSVYWITSLGAVQKLAFDKRGEKPTDLATGVSGLARIAVDEESVYVTAWGTGPTTGRVVRIAKAGGPSIDVAKGLREPWGIAIDDSGVYVANHGDGTVIVLPRL